MVYKVDMVKGQYFAMFDILVATFFKKKAADSWRVK
jgi:hypothetical protein